MSDDDASEIDSSLPDRLLAQRFEALRIYDPKLRAFTDIVLESGTHRAARGKRRSAPSRQSDGSEESDDDDEDVDDKVTRRSSKARATEGRRRLGAARLSAKKRRARVLPSPVVQQLQQPTLAALTTREVAWSAVEVRMAEYVARRVPIVAACMATIKNQVMREGIRFTRDTTELIPSTEFQQYVRQRLIPFCYDCLDSIIVLGVVPILYERDSRSGQPWPYVPAIGSYVIKRHTVAGVVRLRFYWRNSTEHYSAWQRQAIRGRDRQGATRWVGRQEYEPGRTFDGADDNGGIYDPTVEIIHGFGYDLTGDGLLGSKVASLLHMIDRRSRLEFARTVGELNAANPAVFTEYNFAAEKHGSTAFAKGYYTSASVPLQMAGGAGDDGNDLEALAGRTYMRDAQQREALAGLLRTFEQETGQDAAEHFGVKHDEYRSDLGGTAVVQAGAVDRGGVPLPWQRQFHVSSSRVLKNGPTPHVSTDFVSVLTHMDNEVCEVFGVPLTYLQGTSIRAGTDLVSSRLSEEVLAYKRLCGDILTHVYNALFLDADIQTYLTSDERVARMRKSKAASANATPGTEPSLSTVTEQDLFVGKAIGSVQVSFPKNPVERIDELEKLYALGAISRTTLCTEIARRNGIEPNQLFLDEDAELPEVAGEMRQMAFPAYADYIRLKHNERLEQKRIDANAKLADKAHAATAELADKAAAAAPTPAAKPASAPKPTPAKSSASKPKASKPAKRDNDKEDDKDSESEKSE